jgi:[protein-PII] uridylyltransferase
MATRSFLLDEDREDAFARLQLAAPFPAAVAERRREFSLWLEGRLLERLQTFGDFASLHPVLLGSWARHELCPKSDIDLLFAGPEGAVREFIGQAFRAGLKLRARTPEDAGDWSVGVGPFDVLALRNARGFDPAAAELLEAQRRRMQTAPNKNQRRVILSAIRLEREERRKRQDSISNYLEPNLKFGAGGLRDIEQALAVRELFPEKFVGRENYPFEVLHTIKDELLYLRDLLHLLGSNDILSAHDQLELAQRLNMESVQGLMKFVQSELERASFYADWVVAFVTLSRERVELRDATTLAEAVTRLKESADVHLQYRVRLKVDELARPLSAEERGKVLHKALYADHEDAYYMSLYRARVLEVLLPDLKRLRGLVQHDHYHRFTADAHLVQTLREVQRAKTRTRGLGALSKLTRDLSPQEWWTLKLTALFHDLAKGRKSDHSTEGAKLVDKYFTEWGYPEPLRDDVRWLVENHLLISTAAFRQNPQAQSTWKRLFERGVHGRRLILLTLFTAVDIRATNPEAWTEWKAKLLLTLVDNLRSPQAQSFQRHLKYAGKKHSARIQEWLLLLDPLLMESLVPRVLIEDLIAASSAPDDLPVKVVRSRGRLWVRFHRRQDETGTFLGFVKRLYALGLNIQTASVSTLPGIGVYDWFCLRSEKPPRQVAQWLNLPVVRAVDVPKVSFQSIELMAQDADEWIFSFRGRDQRGLLLAAAQALVEEKLSLRWARAHTWGQQIEDVFSVRPLGEVESTLERLRNRFVT